MVAADSAVLVLDGVAGVEVSSEKVWSFAGQFEMPCALFVNKLDRDRSDFNRTVESIHERFGRSAIPVQLPIGTEKKLQWRYRPDSDESLLLFPEATAGQGERYSERRMKRPPRRPTKRWWKWWPKAKTT